MADEEGSEQQDAQKQQCIFCHIVSGKVSSKKVYEDANTIAFLDINPANPGHTLVVPKKHSEDITSADSHDIARAMEVVKMITQRLKERMHAAGVNVIQNNGHAAGQIVAHVHFHVIPRYPNDVVVISYQRAHISDTEMEEIRKKMSETHVERKDYDLEF